MPLDNSTSRLKTVGYPRVIARTAAYEILHLTRAINDDIAIIGTLTKEENRRSLIGFSITLQQI